MVDARGPADTETFLRDVLAAVPSFVVRVGADFAIRYVNRLLPPLRLDEVLGAPFTTFIEPAYRELAVRAAHHVLETGEPTSYHSEAVGPNQTVAYYDVHVVPVANPDGSREFCMVATDITEQIERQRALEASRERLEVALEATRIGLWRWDIATDTVEWSSRMHEITGRAEAVALDGYVEHIVHPDDRAVVAAIGERTRSGTWEATPHRIVRPDGEVRWVTTVGSIATNDAGEPVRVTGGMIDMTEQMALQAALRQAQKMEAVGNVTAGIAHNFNNMLMVIVPAFEMLTAGTISPSNKVVGHALHAARRAADMVAQLMTFAGRRPAERQRPHRLHLLTERAIESAHVGAPIELEFEPTKVNVRCDDGAIEQVVVNVLANARDALVESEVAQPRIRVAIDVVEIAGERRALDGSGGRFARIAIEDNGPGMTGEVQRQIFEPFFTTKGATRGTGLGLATSQAVAREHGGWLECASTPGTGARFDLYLPVTELEPDDIGEAHTTPAMRVLLIDDEPSLGVVLRQTLEPEGFELTAHTRAADALELLDRDPGFAVILLDRSMPGLRSRDLVPQLRARTRASILYFTGQDVPLTELDRVEGVVQKPVMTADLVAAIRAAAR